MAWSSPESDSRSGLLTDGCLNTKLLFAAPEPPGLASRLGPAPSARAGLAAHDPRFAALLAIGNFRTETAMTHNWKISLCLGAALALLTLPASAEDYGPFKAADTSAGKVLVDAKGMTLYTFDKDE